MKYYIALFVVVLVAATSAHIGGQVPNQDVLQSYCGRSLSAALAALCYGNSKRSDPRAYSDLTPFYKEQEHMEWPWMVPYQARSLSGQRGKRQYIVSECCDKACTINELMTYC